MKKPMYKFRFRLISAALGLTGALLAGNAKAANYYFDVNGATAQSGVTAGSTYSWESAFWTTVSAGNIATINLPEGVFPRFAAGTDSAGNYTVTASSDHHIAGMLHSSLVGTVTINGAGILTIDPPQQGFFGGTGGFIRINNKLTGTGGVVSQSGQIYLDGNNDYSGGTSIGSGLINFNNANSFGTGPITVSVSGSAIICEGSSSITITNPWTVSLTAGLNCVGNAAGIIYSGPITLGAFTLSLGNNGTANLDTFSGVISGTGGVGRQVQVSGGTIVFSGANTYSGKTSLQSGITKVASLNSVTTPAQQPSSNLGVPSSSANGTLSFGSTTVAGTLVYTGPGETTDRVLDLAGTTGGAILQADGSGAMVFTSPNTASGVGAKSLTLQGASTANNTIAGRIVDSSSGATAVVKAQGGTWVLSGTNTYTGGTTVNGGTLDISATGIVAGNVTNSGSSTLQIDSNTALSTSATVSINSGGTVNLNFAGAQIINSLFIDGAQQVSGTWGSATSGAANTSAIFTGNGKFNVQGPPVVVQQPVAVVTYPDTNVSFSVVVAGDPSFTYQWKRNNSIVAGATDATYSFMAEPENAGTYFCAITNNFGNTNSASVTLTVLGTNTYVNIIRGDQPISYWRLDESSGNIARDGINQNVGLYNNVNLGVPGFSLTDTDTCVALPAVSGNRGYAAVTNISPFNFNAATPHTLETWAYFTNFTAKQRMISTLHLGAPGGYAFGVLPGGTALELTAGGIKDNDSPTLASPLVPNVWYHLVCTYDGSQFVFYVNGAPVGTVGFPNAGASTGSQSPLNLGSNPTVYTNNTAGDPLGEQVNGRLDEVAIYGYTLTPDQVTNHYSARYSGLSTPVATTPVASPQTNYVSLTSTIQEFAGGTALSYQWYHGATLLSGKTDAALTLANLQLSDAGSYSVVVTNPAGASTSPAVVLTVLSIPTSATDLSLTNGLVLHLPFENTYKDISGRNNNGTNVGATSFVSDGEVGTNALHYNTDTGSSSFNYVTLGVRPDLKFSSNVDFTVSYWVRQPNGSVYTNLPFFTDNIGSIGFGGFCFAPYAGQGGGGWSLSIGSMTSPSIFTSFPDANLINDGNWHLLVHVANRTASVTTYLDGVQVDSEAISFIGDISTANAATIGQDASGAYPVTADADLDDLGVWRRTLTPLEVSGIYLAGATNHVSFAPAITAVPPSSVTISNISGTTLTYGGGTGSQFILLSSSSVTAPLSGWTRVHTNAATPGTFTIPAVGSAGPTFYSIQSQ